jgi:outer membrane lipoprotein carrier protein
MSMERRTVAAALAILAIAAAAVAAIPRGGETLEQVIREISERQKKIGTLEADFVQEKEMALLASSEKSTGRFVYSQPNRVLWTYDAPRQVTMLIADGRLTTYYPELNRAETLEVKRFEDRIFRYMGARGAIDELGKYFDFKFVNAKNDRFYTLELKPKTKTVERRVQRIKIWIDRTTYLTTRFEYVEGDGDLTRYEFRNIRINQPVADSKFVLNLPKSVRVEEIKVN